MILAVVGMTREARLLARVGLRAVVGGGDAGRLAATLEGMLSTSSTEEGCAEETEAPTISRWTRTPSVTALRAAPPPPLRRGGEGWTALLSFGVAGGLDPLLKAGDVVVASGVWTPKQSLNGPGRSTAALPADPAWAARLLASIAGARSNLIAGQDTPAASVEAKAALHGVVGALTVDMESHVVAQVAARHGFPFAAIRAISDPASHALPPAAVAGFGADGGVDFAAVLSALARDPRQLPALLRTGAEAERAFTALRGASAHILG